MDRTILCDEDVFIQQNKYLEFICSKTMYNYIKEDGNYWIYALILTNNQFAHDLVRFEFPKNVDMKLLILLDDSLIVVF